MMIYYKPNICIIGDFSFPADEGMKKVAHQLAMLLSKDYTVLPIHVRNLFTQAIIQKLRGFKPDIIFYVGGPSLLSFAIIEAVSTYCTVLGKRPKTVLFALHPSLHFMSREISRFFRPDVVLTQSRTSESMFRKLGMVTHFFPVGVDTKKFTPVSYSIKMNLRKKYGLNEKFFIVLHVGSVRRNRGLEILTKILDHETCALIVARTSMPAESSVVKKLRISGCIVWLQYFPNIEEIYQLSDLYVFPVMDEQGSIEFPLSVIEAMACNLPIVSTKFGALPRILKEGDGLFFVDNVEEIPEKIKQIRNEKINVKTREKVANFSWKTIQETLSQLFQSLSRE